MTITNEFTALPLIEVALRVAPQAAVPLSFPIATHIIDELRAATPFAEVVEPDIFDQFAHQQFQNSPIVLPLALQMESELGVTLNLQRNVIVLRWRKRQIEDPPEYPRFEAMVKLLEHVIDVINRLSPHDYQFVATAANMSYVNMQLGEDFGSDFPPVVSWGPLPVHIMGEGRSLAEQSLVWSEGSPRCDFRFVVQQAELGTAGSDERVRGAAVTTVCGTSDRPDEDWAQLLMDCHNRLNDKFSAFIRVDYLEKWGWQPKK